MNLFWSISLPYSKDLHWSISLKSLFFEYTFFHQNNSDYIYYNLTYRYYFIVGFNTLLNIKPMWYYTMHINSIIPLLLDIIFNVAPLQIGW